MSAVTALLGRMRVSLRVSSLGQYRAVQWVLHKKPNYWIIGCVEGTAEDGRANREPNRKPI